MKGAPVFCLGGFWHYSWRWSGDEFRTSEKKDGQLKLGRAFVRETDWHHFAATWNASNLVAYVDGRRVGELSDPQRDSLSVMSRTAFRVGTGGDGLPAANLVMDEIAIFRRDLSAAEVEGLATSEQGLLDGRRSLLVESVSFPVYWRDDPHAAIPLTVLSPDAAACTLEVEIDGVAQAPRTVQLASGKNYLSVPFDVARMRTGRHGWKALFRRGGGAVERTCGGSFEVKPRLGRDRFRFFNWGGSKKASVDYLKRIGINAMQCKGVEAVRQALADGFLVNVRFDNDKTQAVRDFDMARMAAEARAEFDRYRGLYAWCSTLVNTEMYYGDRWLGTGTNSTMWTSFAKKELGFEPEWNVTFTPDELDYGRLGRSDKYTGVFDDRSYRSLDWFEEKGNPLYLVGGRIRKIVHSYDAENVVWTEPMMGAGGFARCFDRLADWIYDYPTAACLYNLRRCYARCHPWGRRFTPTLSMEYWHYRIPPTDKEKKPPISQTADELMIKSWMAVGSVPADELSFYAADRWEWGIREPDAVDRYAAFVRDEFAPSCELLRNMANATPPIAFLVAKAPAVTGKWKWGHHHYTIRFGELLAEAPVPFDVLTDHDMTVEALSKYKYVIAPALSALTAEQEATLKKASAAGTVLVGDRYCAFTYPNSVRLDVSYDKPTVSPKLLDEPLLAWYRPKWEELRKDLPAWSDQDGTNAFTFVKEHRGAQYVLVVNNARRRGGAPQNEHCTADWYNPLGAEQRISVRIRVPADAALYDAVRGRRLPLDPKGGEVSFAKTFRPAEGMLVAVYPSAAERLSVTRDGDGLDVRIDDVKQRPLAGRQVVDLEVRDPSGALHDSSGRYPVESGRARIPLRLADGEGLSGRWTVRARERTTGLVAESEFER